MKIISKYFMQFFLLSVLFTSCERMRKSNTGNKFSNIDKNKVFFQDLSEMEIKDGSDLFKFEIKVPEDVQKEILMSEIIDSVWYVKLGDTSNDFMSDYIGEIEIHGGRIYVKDGQKNQIYVFKNTGELLFSINPSGQGPGEFTKASSMAIDYYKNHLIVHDDRLSKIIYYTLDGGFLREQRVGYRFLNFAFINDSLMAVDLNKTDNYHLNEISNNQLVVVDTTWKILAKGGEYNASEERQLFFSGNVFSRKGDQLFYLRPFTYNVYMFDKDRLKPFCRLDFGKRTLPEDTNFKFKWSSDFGEKYADYSYMVANGQFLKDLTYFTHFYEGKKTAFLFRSNNTGKLYYGKVKNDIKSLGFFKILTSIPSENVLVSYLSSEEIYTKKQMILETDDISKSLRELVENIESTDNPVLIFYKLRSDY